LSRHPLVDINKGFVHTFLCRYLGQMQRLLQINCRYFFIYFLLICYFCILMYKGFYARCSNTWSPSVRPSVCKISAIRNSPDCNHAIDWLKLYNVLEIHCLRVADSSSYPLHPAFNENSKKTLCTTTMYFKYII
jgi:hypothetical protein